MQETPVYVFDAAFGSIKQKSDLDVSVTSTDVLALEHWIDWIGKRKECMSRAWDTNFYYEKGVISKNKLVPWNQLYLSEALRQTATVEDIIQ